MPKKAEQRIENSLIFSVENKKVYFCGSEFYSYGIESGGKKDAFGNDMNALSWGVMAVGTGVSLGSIAIPPPTGVAIGTGIPLGIDVGNDIRKKIQKK